MIVSGVGAVGGVAGIIALFQTHKGNELAQKANGTAEVSNGIAADSKRVAEQANDLAGEANEIAADANAISQRALAVTADQTIYKWRVEYDGKTSTVFLVNDCANLARDVQVFVRFEDQTIAQAHIDEVAAFGEVPLKNEFFAQKIIESQRSIDRNNSMGGVFYIGAGTCSVTVHIVWTTGLGSRRNIEVKKGLSTGQRH